MFAGFQILVSKEQKNVLAKPVLLIDRRVIGQQQRKEDLIIFLTTGATRLKKISTHQPSDYCIELTPTNTQWWDSYQVYMNLGFITVTNELRLFSSYLTQKSLFFIAWVVFYFSSNHRYKQVSVPCIFHSLHLPTENKPIQIVFLFLFVKIFDTLL